MVQLLQLNSMNTQYTFIIEWLLLFNILLIFSFCNFFLSHISGFDLVGFFFIQIVRHEKDKCQSDWSIWIHHSDANLWKGCELCYGKRSNRPIGHMANGSEHVLRFIHLLQVWINWIPTKSLWVWISFKVSLRCW